MPQKSLFGGNSSSSEGFFNCMLARGESVIKNAFNIPKQIFRELSCTTKLDVKLLSNVVVSYCLFRNILLGQNSDEIECHMEILLDKGMQPKVDEALEVEPLPLGPPNND